MTFEVPGTLWVGSASLLPGDNFHGMRRDVIARLKKISVPLPRWPGGNFTRDYRWKEGLLPGEKRPPLVSRWHETLPFTDNYDFQEAAMFQPINEGAIRVKRGLLLLGLMVATAAVAGEGSRKTPAASVEGDPTTSRDGAANWPCFRGPGFGGPAPNPGDLPSPLSLQRHKVFDVALASHGNSSPIIWGDRIYLTSEGGLVTAFDRATGKSLWATALQVRVPASAPAEEDAAAPIGSGAGGAAPTPVTDGKFIYAFFGDGVLGCVDAGGKQVWARRVVEGGPKNAYGLAASPVLYGDLVIQVIDRGMNARAKAAFIVAVGAKDGAEVWRKDRPVRSCWTTPLIVHGAAGDVMVTTAPPLVIAYDPRTGQQRWQAKGSSNEELCASPVQCGEGLVAVEASGGLTAFMVAGKGDASNSRVVWTSAAESPEVASPACDGGRCFLLAGETLTCLDAATGKEQWNLELEGTFWASPVLAKDRVYAINKAGVLFVASIEGKKLQEVKLGDAVRATPAILDGRIYLRAAGRLLCVGRP